MEVLVAGAGIGGLATAVALRRAGHEAQVLERASEPAEVGAGLAVWPNGQRALGALGAKDVPGVPVGRLQLLTWRGRLLSEAPVRELRDRCGYDLMLVHRGELHALLLEVLGRDAVQFSSEVTGFEQDGSRVLVSLASGEQREADLLVGADGIRSAVRRTLLADGDPRFSGATCWRGVASFESEKGAAFNWWGPGGEFGVFPLSGRRVYWFGVQNAPQGELDSPRGRKADVLEAFASWPAVISAVVRATDESRILRNDLYDRRPVRSWSRGRVTLVGDAAHPMLPNAAQGACQALADGAALGSALSPGSIEEGLEAYEAQRLRTANTFVSQAHETARAVQSTNPLVRRARDLLTAHVPGWLVRRQLGAMM